VRRRTVALAACALAASAAACGERAEPVGKLPATYPVTVTGAGEQPLVVEAAPRRIVALDPGPAELVGRLGVGERLVGVPAGTKTMGARAPRIVTTAGGAIKVAAVAELEPDLILATPATDTVDLARAERRSGAAAYLQPADSVADVLRGILELGFVLGEPARARRLAGATRRKVEAVEARTERLARVSVFVDTGFLVTVPQRSLVADLVRRAGGVTLPERTTGLDRLDACGVARLRPDLVLVVAPPGARPPTAGPYACRGQAPARLASVPESVVTVAGPRVARAIAVISRALHPDAP
jgi:iron complex transport system substrate-binding protein